MKQFFLRNVWISIFLATTTSYIIGADSIGRPYMPMHAVGADFVPWQIASEEYYHQCCTCDLYCVGYAAVKAEQSYDRDDTARYFFFNGRNTMRFADPFAPGNSTGVVDVDVLNFLLNTNIIEVNGGFDSQITARPRATNVVAEFGGYIGLDRWIRNLYFFVRAPVNWNQTTMNLGHERIASKGTGIAPFLVGNPTAAASPYTSIVQAWNGQLTTPFFDVKSPLGYGRINGKKSTTRLANIECALGYDFKCGDVGHFGVYADIVLPTGNKPKGIYVFESIAGNGGHFGFGGGASWHYFLWDNPCSSLAIYHDSYIRHLCNTEQRRTFPLTNNGAGSQYLLIKEFTPGTGTYAGVMDYGANILTRKCHVSISIEGETSLMFEYARGNLLVDVGLDIWGRTRETIKDIARFPAQKYALAGSSGGSGSPNANRTASLVQINGSFSDVFDTITVTQGQSQVQIPFNVYLKPDDLDRKEAAAIGVFTLKPFLAIGYTAFNNAWEPFISIGAGVEISGSDNNVLKQWSLILKGGFAIS